MQGKKWIAAALVCGFLLGQGTAPAQAGILGTVVKGGAVSLLVSQFADQLNSAINTLTAKYPISSDYATKVVPIITVGDGSYAGAAGIILAIAAMVIMVEFLTNYLRRKVLT